MDRRSKRTAISITLGNISPDRGPGPGPGPGPSPSPSPGLGLVLDLGSGLVYMEAPPSVTPFQTYSLLSPHPLPSRVCFLTYYTG